MNKKRWVGILILLPTISFLYSIFPIKYIYSLKKTVTSSEVCVQRHFVDKNLFEKIQIGAKLNDSTYSINDINFVISKVLLNGFYLKISKNEDTLNGLVYFEGALGTKNCYINFSTLQNASTGIYAKYNYSNLIKKFESNIKVLMSNIENFFNNPKKVYGFEVKIERTTDNNLLVYKEQLKQEPTVNEVYQIIEKIGNYISSKKGEIKNFPMLNIFKESPQVYNMMIAIPTKNPVEGSLGIFYKQLVDGNILVAKIEGGPYTIKKAELEMKNYIDDTKKISPAIPYQSLITNRKIETDTSKWITKLYYPVFF